MTRFVGEDFAGDLENFVGERPQAGVRVVGCANFFSVRGVLLSFFEVCGASCSSEVLDAVRELGVRLRELGVRVGDMKLSVFNPLTFS